MHFGYSKLLVFLDVTEAEFVGSAASSGSGHCFLTLTHAQNRIFSFFCAYVQICIMKDMKVPIYSLFSQIVCPNNLDLKFIFK